MNYETAYLYLFNTLTDLIKLLESTDPGREVVDTAALLRRAQAEAEERCIQ